eukprot:1484187-Alexandrium_andersonii.AAC.1
MADALLGRTSRRRSTHLARAFVGFGLGPLHGMLMYERVAVMRRNAEMDSSTRDRINTVCQLYRETDYQGKPLGPVGLLLQSLGEHGIVMRPDM